MLVTFGSAHFQPAPLRLRHYEFLRYIFSSGHSSGLTGLSYLPIDCRIDGTHIPPDCQDSLWQDWLMLAWYVTSPSVQGILCLALTKNSRFFTIASLSWQRLTVDLRHKQTISLVHIKMQAFIFQQGDSIQQVNMCILQLSCSMNC